MSGPSLLLLFNVLGGSGSAATVQRGLRHAPRQPRTIARHRRLGQLLQTDQWLADNMKFDDNNRLAVDTDNLTGIVSGPSSSTDNAVARYDGTGGKTLQNSGVTIDDSGNIAAVGANQRIRSFGVAEVETTQPTPVKGMAWLDTGTASISSLRTITEIATDTTIDSSYDVVLVDALIGSVTVTLPAASAKTGKQFDIKKIDSSSNTVTIDGNASETIDGAATAVITTQFESVTIVSDGTEWWIL